MKQRDDIERLIASFQVGTHADMDRRILSDATAALRNSRPARREGVLTGITNMGRYFMTTRWCQVVTAAGIIAAVVLFLQPWGAGSPAYAIEQTLEANKSVRSVHLKHDSPSVPTTQEVWMEFDPNGEPTRARIEEGTGDTFRIMIFEGPTSLMKLYRPAKKQFIIMDMADQFRGEMSRVREQFDPRLVVEDLNEKAKSKDFQAKIVEPTKPNQPITMTVTGKVAGNEVRYVLLIDPNTKLATRREDYLAKNGKLELYTRLDYLEYNKPLDETLFHLEPPPGVTVEDMTQGKGMPQEKMTDEQAAAKVVRKFIQALVDKDYAAAARLCMNVSAEEIRQRAEKREIRYVRVVSVGTPEALPDGGPRAYRVPFQVEIEKDGKKEISRTRDAAVRPLTNKPDHWIIKAGL